MNNKFSFAHSKTFSYISKTIEQEINLESSSCGIWVGHWKHINTNQKPDEHLDKVYFVTLLALCRKAVYGHTLNSNKTSKLELVVASHDACKFIDFVR